MRLRTLFAVVGVTVGLVGCDSGPKGPGALDATITGPEPLGAALVEVVGAGVRGFEDQGACQTFGAPLPSAVDTHRALVVCAGGGDLVFGIEVDDVSAEPPVATVLQTANPNNVVVLSTQVSVRIRTP